MDNSKVVHITVDKLSTFADIHKTRVLSTFSHTYPHIHSAYYYN
ncbi:hypothetical protein D2E25_1554 [Bifidobacterium goeldii]|uniref:Uncharacterized protein n=1 Tax=Bifidobacterium goeldii TaxID=2306975 RepID=A0A430FGZ8_9BIFI|nr:hypothetical protein D2E25_1554 [Bifidobacterium goeldii]